MYLLSSPDGELNCRLIHNNDRTLTYNIFLNGAPVLGNSPLGLALKGMERLFFESVSLVGESQCDKDETLLWGQSRTIRDHHNYYRFQCFMTDGKEKLVMDLEFKAYNGGLAFRYSFYDDDCRRGLIVEQDLTGYNLEGDLLCSFTRGERAPEEAKPFSLCNFDVSPVPSNLPVITHSGETGLYMALFESAPVNFSQMHLAKDHERDYALRSRIEASELLVGDERVFLPWRIILASSEPGNFLTSTMALNLAGPCPPPIRSGRRDANRATGEKSSPSWISSPAGRGRWGSVCWK